MSGKLFIVATPIGNLGDISERALDVLRQCAVIAVEDTRHSSRLLQAYNIPTPMIPYHDFNEAHQAAGLLDRVERGEDVALISDAGTPLVSDPGYQLVRLAHQRSLRVVPVPGASAAIAALCSAGLASDRFTFEGFLPARSAARKAVLLGLSQEQRTMVFYEAPHRIVECLVDMVECLGAQREATLARELTKSYETIVHNCLLNLHEFVAGDANQQRGEIVLVVAGYKPEGFELGLKEQEIMQMLMEELSVKKASALCARITGAPKKELYDLGLRLQGKKD